MKDRMERLVILPFTVGCISSASVAVCAQNGRRPKEHVDSVDHTVCRSMEVVKEAKSTSSDEIVKGLSKLPTISKPNNVYIGFHRITRTIKSLSQALVFKEDAEGQEMDMEIGVPTNVKHVTHIGLDGSLTDGVNGCNHLAFSELLSLCPHSMTRCEERAIVEPACVTHDTQATSCKVPR